MHYRSFLKKLSVELKIILPYSGFSNFDINRCNVLIISDNFIWILLCVGVRACVCACVVP